tara:strand:+ start:13475 stop:20908 length:7434 start_codon:yes stop_codon:yes gene_type:complete
MPQKTNLNVSPYYDDFDKDDNFYKVLFKPGHPVQARELTGLQSILQNQIESFGSHMFKEGSMVIPGGITCDNAFTTIKVNPDHLGIDITVYLDAIVSGKGTKVKGVTSEVVGTIKGYILPTGNPNVPDQDIEEITLFVKYLDGANDGESVEFLNGEVIQLLENVTYGNTTLVEGDTVFSLTTVNSPATGYAVGVAQGVYFIRGTFVDVQDSQIVLDPYSNTPSYRVGFDIVEEIINSDEDPSLNDNAKGFTNYAAPGADRLKISLKLAKKELTDNEDTNFVELVKIDEGVIKKLQNKSDYNLIRDYFAKRTFEESGDYAVDSFIVEASESLNNETGNGGLFRSDEVTDEGNTPTEDLMAVKVSAGTAYVRGYDIDLVGSTVVDVEKPRTTKTIPTSQIPFTMGSLLRVNNVSGVPYINIGDTSGANTTDSNIIELYKERRNHNGSNNITDQATAGLTTKIGEARVYWFGVTDDSYKGNATEWDLFLYDVQTFTELTLSNTYNQTEAPLTSMFRGLSSGATGYLAESSGNIYKLNQTSGEFLVGEQIIINEEITLQTGIQDITVYTTEDIKAVFQDADALNSNIQQNFLANTVLHEVGLPNFAKTDLMNISGSTTTRTAKVGGRFFNGVTGIKKGRTIKYQNGNADPIYADITAISADGTNISLTTPAQAVTGVFRNVHTNGNYTFSMMVPRIINFGSTGLYSPLPVANIASVDLSGAQLTITKQITGKSVSGNSMEITVADAIDTSAGITSVFYESFDAERYSIHYSDGTTEKLTSGMATLGSGGASVTFDGLSKSTDSNVTVIATLSKRTVTDKSKDFIRSQQLEVTRTQKTKTLNNLTNSKYFGTRIEDKEISLNVPDVVDVRAIYESTDGNTPILDKLTFATGLSLDQNVIIGEKITGKDGRAIGQVVSATATEVFYVPRNTNNFIVGENVKFGDSALDIVIQQATKGSYVDITANYKLDDGHRHEFCDYSRIIKRPGAPTPDKKLLIIFDKYEVASGNSGDVFTCNSYGASRYKSDIPSLPNGIRATDLVDFRPRVKPFDLSTNASPFGFSTRQYESTFRYVITPDETSFFGYSYYLPRIDLVSINRLGQVEVLKGEPADIPQAPVLADDAMEIAQISLPAYLYNTAKDPRILLRDNRRFTMRDIGKLEDRIENLEEVTSLTMLELNAKTLSVTDANGLDRFKSGFIVSDFRDKSLADPRYTTIDISKEGATGIAPIDFWSMDAQLALDPNIDISSADLSQNLKLADPSIQKTGDMLTLAYTEVDWLDQPHATNVENVNPFNVIVFQGAVALDPASDNWVRTIYIDDHRTESTGAKWKQEASVTRDVDKKTEYVTYKKGGGRGERGTRAYTTTTITTETKYKPKLTGPSREFDYVEDVKVSGEADPWMRSRNVYFNANGLRPYSKHYLYLDSQQVDIVPKLCEINMISGTFTVFEDANILDANDNKVGFIRIQKPNHKFGDTSRPDIGAGLGSPAVLVEKYTVDPYDRNRPAPGDGYSPTSKLINFGTRVLSTQQKYFGYIEKGFKIVGTTSGAVAKITRAELISDNWGDIVANFFFRDPNSKPKPATRVKSGTKTVKVTAVPPNTVVLPGSTVFASEALGTYSGSGTVLTQETSRVSVRNPPKPARKATEINVEVKAPHRDPLAQSFTVDGVGAFLTSFDLYFATKDPGAKVFVELRTMELGTPTSFLVQDYTQVALNPDDINVNVNNPFEPVPTRVRFPSPVYLEAEKEYAIVILSPASDGYEMWTATMGQKTVRTSTLPDVQNVVVTKQYIGGSLFKSQNGTIWTASQFQDLTFKLYKAKFVNSGTVTWYNSDITPKGTNSAVLNENPVEGLPRKLKLPIAGTLSGSVNLGTRVIQGATGSNVNGFVENFGAAASGIEVDAGGTGYKASQTGITGAQLYSISGKGTGGIVSIDTDADGKVTSATLTTNGSGYVNGEMVGIVTSTIGATAATRVGTGAKFTISNISASTDTLYLTDVQGEHFTNTSDIFYLTDPTNLSTRVNSGADASADSSLVANEYSGNVFRVKQQNHAHHGGNNKIQIVDIAPDTSTTQTTSELTDNSTQVSVANTTIFSSFEGITTSRGYALLGSEIISYNGINETTAPAGTLTINGRSIGGSSKITHAINSTIQPYEVNGVSLARINTTHDIPSTYYKSQNSNIDTYHLEFDRTLLAPTDRSSGGGMVNFTSEKGFGGKTVGISQNYQFSSLEPLFNIITPGKGTKARCNVRTISGTSAGGNETSFIDKGYEPVTLNKVITFQTPRMVASEINETERLTELPANKSLTLRVDFRTENENLSPMMDTQNATFVLGRNKSNQPIDDYVNDSRSNDVEGDPHGAVFVTKGISLAQPATSLKVIIAANRQEDADFRVFYQLFKADSSGVEQKFIPFPGYDNLIDTDGDGFGDQVIDPNKNSGRADAFVPPNLNDKNAYSEYQFSVDNVDQFTAFAIKIVLSSTNESTPVKLKDFRAIALA